jgi:hypothetical protein
MIDLITIEENFIKIINSKDSWDKKNQSLSFLMTQIEKFYKIPLSSVDLSEEKKNSEEFKLYLKISSSRKF